MGSQGVEADSNREEINVLVTGFGPFGNNSINPSFLIASSLPTSLNPPKSPRITTHAHPTPLRVSYQTVRETVPELNFPTKDQTLDSAVTHRLPHHVQITSRPSKQKPNFDIVLHIGMASGRKFYTLETRAHRDGYKSKDVDGNTLDGDTFWEDTYGAPEILQTSFDTEDVWRRWKSELVNEDLRPSTDAGHYLCDFTYYTSLLEYWRRDHDGARPVMFLHVPGGSKEEDVERGRRVAVGLIRALVGSLKGGAGGW